MTFLIKNMGAGSWSSKVLAESSAVRLEGPYGGPGLFPGHCTDLVLIGGGVGLSALARLWEHPPEGVSRVVLVWVTRCPEAIDWLAALLPNYNEGPANGSSIQVFVTRQAIRPRLPSVTWAAGITQDDAINNSPSKGHRNRESTAQQPLPMDSRQVHTWHGSISGSALEEALNVDLDWDRQSSWAESVAATSQCCELAQHAAALPWDANDDRVKLAPHLTLRSGRPDFSKVFEELVSGRQNSSWGAIACGPQVLVDQTRCCAMHHGMRFHAEESAW